ncbi:MAG: CapA family protein [Bacteroidales bacterium]|nr:CapA family protein [Bacteroidales bacterium]MDD2425371.1 CapA family protein [Bacteroidales bacterium]MDD3988788.1 CapA family protein [Bacteroidales bacterium]MDD4639405.1 CapA family protein [Bacteroidales bacterium]
MKTIFLLAIPLMLISVFPGKRDTLNMIFIGDIMQHSSQIESARKIAQKKKTETGVNGERYDYTGCFRFLKETLNKADITVANMESTFAGEPFTGYPSFSSPPSLLKAAVEAGTDIFLTANNHINDKGSRGIEKTIRLFDSLGIKYTGVSRSRQERENTHPLVIESKGFRIAILNYTYGTNGVAVKPPYMVNLIDTAEIASDLKRCNSGRYDLTVVCIHWGNEYSLSESSLQREIAGFIISLGGDVIIGSHPHVPQPLVINKSADGAEIASVIFYSLGNAISNMSAPYTRIGQMAVIRAVKDPLGKARLLEPDMEYIWTARPGAIDDNYTIIPVSSFAGKPGEFKVRADYDKMMYYYSLLKK